MSLPRQAGSGGEGPGSAAASDSGPANFVGKWLEETAEFWEALELIGGPSIEEDESEEAQAVVEQNLLIESIQNETTSLVSTRSYLREKADTKLGNELNKMPFLVFAYYKMKISRVLDKKVVKKGLVSFVSFLYLLFVVVFFRTVLPRLLAVQSVDDLFGVAGDMGIPSRSNLLNSIRTLQDYDTLPKVALFQLAFILEKLTLVSEILPIQIGLKTISPLLFGGLIPGALMSATCETIGATCNFFIGRKLLTDQLPTFSIFGSEPLGEAKWFGALLKAAEEQGLRLVLLLRLAHVLPIPFDLYWYILGALPVAAVDFVAAHWLGCLKTAFLDGALGELLLNGAILEGTQKQQYAFAEAAGFAIVALAVSSIATGLAKDLLGLDEEEPGEGGDAGNQQESLAPAGGEGGGDSLASGATSAARGDASEASSSGGGGDDDAAPVPSGGGVEKDAPAAAPSAAAAAV